MKDKKKDGKKEYRKPELVKRGKLADVAEGAPPPIS